MVLSTLSDYTRKDGKISVLTSITVNTPPVPEMPAVPTSMNMDIDGERPGQANSESIIIIPDQPAGRVAASTFAEPLASATTNLEQPSEDSNMTEPPTEPTATIISEQMEWHTTTEQAVVHSSTEMPEQAVVLPATEILEQPAENKETEIPEKPAVNIATEILEQAAVHSTTEILEKAVLVHSSTELTEQPAVHIKSEIPEWPTVSPTFHDTPSTDIPEWPPVMTFEPTMEEFCDLTALIRRMEAAGAHRAGIAKIRPPEEWVARRQGYRPSEIELEIQAPVQQTLAPTSIDGAFQATHKPFPKLRVEAFRYGGPSWKQSRREGVGGQIDYAEPRYCQYRYRTGPL